MLLFFLVLLAVSCLVTPLPVQAEPKTIVVPDDYIQIQEAIDAANEGDTIFVKKGVYVENPWIAKSVSLVGEDMDTTVIDVTAGLKIKSNNVTVTGFTIFDGYEGISVYENCSNIIGNKITNVQNGIVLHSGENSSISGNILESIGPGAAIVLWYSDNNLVNNNYVDSCTEGIQLRSGSSFNMVKENIVTDCKNVAVRLLGGGYGKIWYYPNDNTITRNEISNSGCGITIYGSNNNIISNNNFVNNTDQFSANEWYFIIWGGSVSVNTIDENYWSTYDGADVNADGIGDAPYVLDENNTDSKPLMKPVSIPAFPDSITPTAVPSPTSSPEPALTAEPLPTTIIIAAVTTGAVIGIGLPVYFKKRKNSLTN